MKDRTVLAARAGFWHAKGKSVEVMLVRLRQRLLHAKGIAVEENGEKSQSWLQEAAKSGVLREQPLMEH